MNKYIDAPLCLRDNNYYIGYTIFILSSFACWSLMFNFNISGDDSGIVVNLTLSIFFMFLIALVTRFICVLNYKGDYLLSDSDDDDRIRYYDVNLYN